MTDFIAKHPFLDIKDFGIKYKVIEDLTELPNLPEYQEAYIAHVNFMIGGEKKKQSLNLIGYWNVDEEGNCLKTPERHLLVMKSRNEQDTLGLSEEEFAIQRIVHYYGKDNVRNYLHFNV